MNSLHGTTNDITTEQYQWREVQFTATTVPEPSSLFLSQAGLMLLVLRRKR
ncbi:MAG: PEP-CTERM sorting domain-containing protein [Verrucomicrobiales bacterium]